MKPELAGTTAVVVLVVVIAGVLVTQLLLPVLTQVQDAFRVIVP